MWRVPVSLAALVGLGIAIGLGVAYAGSAGPGRFDMMIDPVLWVDGAGPRRWLWALVLVGEPSVTAICGLVVFCVAIVARRPRVAVLVILGPGLVAAGTGWLAQPVVGRTLNQDLSYPSGHTVTTFSIATVALILLLAFAWPRQAVVRAILVVLLMALPVAVAVSLVALGLHYATDTIGGACAAVGVVLGVAVVTDAVAERWTGTSRSVLARGRR